MANKNNNLKVFLDHLEKNRNININTLSMMPYQGMTPTDIKKSLRSYKLIFKVWDKYTSLGVVGKQAKEELRNKNKISGLLSEAKGFKDLKKYNIAKNQIELKKINAKLQKEQFRDRGTEALKKNVVNKFMEATPLGQFFKVGKGALEELGFSFNKKEKLEDQKYKTEVKLKEWQNKEFIPAQMKFVDAIEKFTKSITGEPTTLEKRQIKENERNLSKEKKKEQKIENRKDRAKNKNEKIVMRANQNIDKDMDALISNTDPSKQTKKTGKQKFNLDNIIKESSAGRRMLGAVALFSGLGSFAKDYNRAKGQGKNALVGGIMGEQYDLYNKKSGGFFRHEMKTDKATSKKNLAIATHDITKYAQIGYGLGSTLGDEKMGLLVGALAGVGITTIKFLWDLLKPYLVDMGNLLKFIGDLIGSGFENIVNTFKEFTGTSLSESQKKQIEQLNEERNILNKKLLGAYTEEDRLKYERDREEINRKKEEIYKEAKRNEVTYRRNINPLSGKFGKIQKVDDFVIRPNGQILKSNPDDTIFGVKNFSEKTIDRFNESSIGNVLNKINISGTSKESLRNEMEMINLIKEQNKLLEELIMKNNSGNGNISTLDLINRDNSSITKHFVL
jgi:hypothetical protein